MILFQRKQCMLPIYILAAMNKFGAQALDWDPLILRDAFQSQFNCKLGQKAFDKLMAGAAMVGTNLFTSSIQTFLACTALCANKPVRDSQLSYVDLQDCCWSVFTWKDLIGYDPQSDTQRFDQDIVMYVQQLMDIQGISKLPEFMDFAKFDENKMTRIQQALVSDAMAFQAYNIRQSTNMSELKAFVKQQQQILVGQLKQLQGILKSQPKLSEIAKK